MLELSDPSQFVSFGMFLSRLVKIGMAPGHLQLVVFQKKAIEVVRKSEIPLYDLINFFNAMS